MNLDDLDYFASIDPQNYARAIDALPEQVAAAWAQGQAAAWPAPSAAHVVLVGRGDSAIAGDLARAACLPDAARPITLWTQGALPAWVGADTVVIALSHSGNTAEVLEAAHLAQARGAAVLAITSGGRLAETAGLSVWRYPAGLDSRDAFGHLALLTLAALTRLKVTPDPSAEVAEAVAALQRQQTALRAASPVSGNPAKRMAGQLMGRHALLFVADELAPAGRRWQAQINQLAKAWAHCVPLNEADHAVAGMLFPETLVHNFMTLFLRGAGPSARADRVRHAFMTNGYNTDAIAAAGRSRLAQLLTLAHYGDYVAYFLAMCYAVDPAAEVKLEPPA